MCYRIAIPRLHTVRRAVKKNSTVRNRIHTQRMKTNSAAASIKQCAFNRRLKRT